MAILDQKVVYRDGTLNSPTTAFYICDTVAEMNTKTGQLGDLAYAKDSNKLYVNRGPGLWYYIALGIDIPAAFNGGTIGTDLTIYNGSDAVHELNLGHWLNSSGLMSGRLMCYKNGAVYLSFNVDLSPSAGAWIKDHASYYFNILQLASDGSLTYYTDAPSNDGVPSIKVRFDSIGRIFERSRATSIGEWTNVPYNISNFYAGPGGTPGWTVTVLAGDITTLCYTLIGKTMTITFFIHNMNIAGSPGYSIRFTIPGGFATPVRHILPVIYFTSAGYENGWAFTEAGYGFVEFRRMQNQNWVNSNGWQIFGQVTLQVS